MIEEPIENIRTGWRAIYTQVFTFPKQNNLPAGLLMVAVLRNKEGKMSPEFMLMAFTGRKCSI